MTEYFIVYDVQTGAERWRGSGSTGATALQDLPEGLAAIAVPMAAVVGEAVDLNVIRASYASLIDQQAEAVCLRFATPGATQMMRYKRKEDQARAWQADNTASVPMIEEEAQLTGVTVAALVATVLAMADQWNAVMDKVEPARICAKKAVADAQTLPAIIAAAVVDWDAVLGAAP